MRRTSRVVVSFLVAALQIAAAEEARDVGRANLIEPVGTHADYLEAAVPFPGALDTHGCLNLALHFRAESPVGIVYLSLEPLILLLKVDLLEAHSVHLLLAVPQLAVVRLLHFFKAELLKEDAYERLQLDDGL